MNQAIVAQAADYSEEAQSPDDDANNGDDVKQVAHDGERLGKVKNVWGVSVAFYAPICKRI